MLWFSRINRGEEWEKSICGAGIDGKTLRSPVMLEMPSGNSGVIPSNGEEFEKRV